MILRVFEVRARPGCVDALREKLSGTSVDVVRGEPGNLGHYFGSRASSDGRDLVFVSVWQDFASVRARFGTDWTQAHLPPGYAELMEACSLEHFEVEGEFTAP